MVVLFEKLLIPLQVTFSCFICVTSTLTPPTSRLIPPPRQVSVISMVEFVSEEQGCGWGGGGGGCWAQLFMSIYTAISGKVVGKYVHSIIPKDNMGYAQYTVPDTVAVEPTFVGLSSIASHASHAILSNFFEQQ